MADSHEKKDKDPYKNAEAPRPWGPESGIVLPPLRREPATEARLASWERQLWEQGWLLLKGAMESRTVDYYLDRLKTLSARKGGGPVHNPVYTGPDFSALMLHEPVYSLMKRILGPDMHLWLSEGHIMDKNYTISGWHVDELHLFRPENISDRVDYPPALNSINCHYYLVDVPLELGPTQIVPYSHLSHRYPRKEDGDPPRWRGQEPLTFTVKAGDCVIYPSNAWHRGAPITCDQSRYSAVIYYARRFMAQRHRESHDFHPPAEMLGLLSKDEKEMIGQHEHPQWHYQYRYQDPGAKDSEHPTWIKPRLEAPPSDPGEPA